MTTLLQLAYLDPGSGSLIIQGLAAAAMAIVVSFQSIRMWIKSIIFSIFKKKSDKEEPPNEK